MSLDSHFFDLDQLKSVRLYPHHVNYSLIQDVRVAGFSVDSMYKP